MATQAGSLPPLDVTRAPEGGEIGAGPERLAAGAARVRRSNRLAVTGFGILALLRALLLRRPAYLPHRTDQHQRPALREPAAIRRQHLLGTDGQGFDELGRIMKGGQAALEIGFFAAFDRHRHRHAVRRRLRTARRARGLDSDARGGRLPVRPVPVRRADPGGQVRRLGAVAVAGHRGLRLAGAGPAGPRRGAHAAGTRLRPGRADGGSSNGGWSAGTCSRTRSGWSSST